MYTTRKRKYDNKKKITKRKSKKLSGGQNESNISGEGAREHSGFIKPLSNLASGIANNAANAIIDKASSLTGIDLTNQDSVDGSLQKFYEILKNPKIQAEIKKTIGEGAKVLAAGLEASKPAIDEMISTTGESLEKAGKKIGNAAVNAALSTLQAVPGVDVVLGAVRAADGAFKAAEAVTESATEVITSTSDAVKEISEKINEAKNGLPDITNMNFENPLKDIGKINNQTNLTQKQTGGSIAEFHDTTLNPERFKNKNDSSSKHKKKFSKNKTLKQ